MISLIVAHDKNRVIGFENKMPWHLPGELKYFKDMTMGKPMIMGRKTFESIGRPLPGRRNIIVTRNKEYFAEGIEVTNSLDDAIALAGNENEIMIIGGEEIFKLALPIADRLYITHIDFEFSGDTYFPKYGSKWTLTSCSEPVDSNNGFTFTYCIYDRSDNVNE
nr:type 3 dihydrofolate reductase [Lysinibacillus timonensis]